MTEIVLPIKCSTVKKADSVLNRIFNAEGVVTIILFVLWSITLNYRCIVAPSSFYPDFDTAALEIILSWLGCFFLVFCIVISDTPMKIYNMLPSLACIKDEEDKP